MKKAVISALSCLFLTLVFPAAAQAQELTVGGQVVGIQIRTEGVLVAGLAEVETAGGPRSPATDAGIHAGDLILEADGQKLSGAGALIRAVAAADGAPLELTVRREEKTLRITVQPQQSAEGQWLMGMWLRDGVSGIGTVTFCDPASGLYGALGHSVSDGETEVQLPLSAGSITDAEVVSVTKGAPGSPGELNGCADMNRILGTVEKNTGHGVFGHAAEMLSGPTVEIGQIRVGPASILSTVSGRQPREYAVEITRIYHEADGAHVLLNVTDPALRELTGGIVQGMSGSPILQEGKLVGAVTHVSVTT